MTNTVVQPDLDGVYPVGVTNHNSRVLTPSTNAVSNDTFMPGATLIGENMVDAVACIIASAPDAVVLGMSAVTFFGGLAGADQFKARIEAASG